MFSVSSRNQWLLKLVTVILSNNTRKIIIQNFKFLKNLVTKDEIQLWTSYINKLNNLVVQLDAPHIKDILMNLQNNNSVYIQSFGTIKTEIRSVSL